MVKEEKYMENKKATIKRKEDETSLVLHSGDEEFSIILTNDDPEEIKDVFNRLLEELKGGLIKFELEDDNGDDLYHDISEEYIKQLNSELEEVYKEMKEYSLLEVEE